MKISLRKIMTFLIFTHCLPHTPTARSHCHSPHTEQPHPRCPLPPYNLHPDLPLSHTLHTFPLISGLPLTTNIKKKKNPLHWGACGGPSGVKLSGHEGIVSHAQHQPRTMPCHPLGVRGRHTRIYLKKSIS